MQKYRKQKRIRWMSLLQALCIICLLVVEGGTLSARAETGGAGTGSGTEAGGSQASGQEASGAAAAAEWPAPDFQIQSEGAILIDADSGVMLYGKNEHAPYFPASITKVMTAALVLENCTNLEDKVTFSYEAVNTNLEPNSTIIGAIAGDRLSVRDCLYCLLLHSANDVANALAEYVSGSNEKFAELMNQKAAELGCTDTHFVNPSGLNNPEHYTSCADMARILRWAIRNETFLRIDQTQVYTHAPIKRYPEINDPNNTVYAHHRMMRQAFREYYPGVFAGKTGYTVLAGNTLVTACGRDGMNLICVILNGHSSHYTDTRNLFDFGFRKYESLRVNTADRSLTSLGNNLRLNDITVIDALTFSIDDRDHITIPRGTGISEVSSELHYDLTDEERADGSIARVDYRYADRGVGSAYVRLLDESEAHASELRDAAVMEAKVQETVPETISLVGAREESVQDPAAEHHRTPVHAPILFDREAGRIVLQKPVRRLLLILLVIAAVSLTVIAVQYVLEHHSESIRKRRRNRMLLHTRDLTREQKARRDLLLSNRTSTNQRKKRRR